MDFPTPEFATPDTPFAVDAGTPSTPPSSRRGLLVAHSASPRDGYETPNTPFATTSSPSPIAHTPQWSSEPFSLHRDEEDKTELLVVQSTSREAKKCSTKEGRKSLQESKEKELDQADKWAKDPPRCCKQNCLSQKFKGSSSRLDVMKSCILQKHSQGNMKHRYFFFMKQFESFMHQTGDSQNAVVFKYKVKGKEVCLNAYKLFYGFSMNNRKYFEKIQHGLLGSEPIRWGGTVCGYTETNHRAVAVAAQRQGSKIEHARKWMQANLKRLSCDNPAARGARFQIGYLKKKDIWLAYKAWSTEQGQANMVLNENHFLALWKKEFSEVSTKKNKSVSSKCNPCASLQAARVVAQKRLDFAALNRVMSLLNVHFQWQGAFRDWYQSSKDAAARFPTVIGAACSDGAASLGHSLPRAKNYQGNKLIDQKITGTLVHGKEFVCFRSYKNVTSDANLQVEVWFQVLLRMKDNVPAHFLAQVDGGSENACNLAIGFWAEIVERGIVDSVQISRLELGHTHTGVDSGYGTANRELASQQSVLHPQGFKKIYLQGVAKHLANEAEADEIHMEDIFFTHDWRGYLEPCMDPEIGYLFKKQHTHSVIVIFGQMDPSTRKIEARMQARRNPPINGHSVGATVVVDNVSDILKKLDEDPEATVEKLGQETLKKMLHEEQDAEDEGIKHLQMIRSESDWAGWVDHSKPGVPVFVKPRKGDAPTWKVEQGKLFVGTPDLNKKFLAEVNGLKESSGIMSTAAVGKWYEWTNNFPPPPPPQDNTFTWPTPSKARMTANMSRDNEFARADAILLVRQGRDSFSHKLNSKSLMQKKKRARDKKVDKVLAQAKLVVKFERLKTDTWVVLKLRPPEMKMAPNQCWCIGKVVSSPNDEKISPDDDRTDIQITSDTQIQVHVHGRRLEPSQQRLKFSFLAEEFIQPLFISKPSAPNSKKRKQQRQEAFIHKVALSQIFFANQVKLCRFPVNRGGSGKRDLLEGFLTTETLIKISNEKELGFEWWKTAQQRNIASSSSTQGATTAGKSQKKKKKSREEEIDLSSCF